MNLQRLRACMLLLVLCLSAGCGDRVTAWQQLEPKRAELEQARQELQQLEDDIKELPVWQADIEKLERKKKQLLKERAALRAQKA